MQTGLMGRVRLLLEFDIRGSRGDGMVKDGKVR